MNQINFISKNLEEKLDILSELFKQRNNTLKEFTPDKTEYDGFDKNNIEVIRNDLSILGI